MDAGRVCAETDGPLVRTAQALLWRDESSVDRDDGQCPSVLVVKSTASSGADACWKLDLSDLLANTIPPPPICWGLPEVLLCAEPMTGSLPCDITDLKA